VVDELTRSQSLHHTLDMTRTNILNCLQARLFLIRSFHSAQLVLVGSAWPMHRELGVWAGGPHIFTDIAFASLIGVA